MPKIRKGLSNQRYRKRFGPDRNRRSARSGPGSKIMKSTPACTWIVLTTFVALAGCQSGPRWAWWKRDSAVDSSVAARTAEPTLPSAQSAPQPVPIAGLTPAAPPSSNNLAAAGTAPLPAGKMNPAVGIPIPPSSQSTLTNAPAANYNTSTSLADKLTAKSSTAMPPSSSALPSMSTPSAFAASPTTPPLAPSPSAGPYDPKAYNPATSLASSGPDPLGASAAGADRYATNPAAPAKQNVFGMSDPGIPTAADRYGALPSTQSQPAATRTSALATQPATQPAIATSDRYGNPSPPLTNQSQMIPPLPSANIAAPMAAPTAALNSLATPTAAAAPSSVQLAAAPGQYRPGGTSSYTTGATTQPLEVAARPSPATTTNPAPAQSVAPASSSVPWTPPASTTPQATRTY
jgi:hypothetical protein